VAPFPPALCGICGREIDRGDLERRDTGDFHRACFDGLVTSGLGIANALNDGECQLCSASIASGSVIVQMFETRVAHLRCFFGEPNRSARSLGAGTRWLSAPEAGSMLRTRSTALLARSRTLRRRAMLRLGMMRRLGVPSA
jgi:hypothetical protein